MSQHAVVARFIIGLSAGVVQGLNYYTYDIDGVALAENSGISVSINGNGNIVAFGAPFSNENGTRSGKVQIYEYTSGGWIQKGTDIDGAYHYWLGLSVSLNFSGEIVAISAPYASSDNGNDSGLVKIYNFLGGDWVQKGIDIDGESAFDLSGFSVSINANVDIVAIGAIYNDGNGEASGHARVYDLSSVLVVNDNSSLHYSIYPNPVQDMLFIGSDTSIEIESIQIYSLLGELVITQEGDTHQLNVSKLSSGVYILKVNTSSGEFTKKLVKE